MVRSRRTRRRGVKSLGRLGSVTARGLTRRFFLERQRFELFSRNQRNQTGERKLLARKSSVLKALDWCSGLSQGQIGARSSIYFPRTLRRGGRQKSGIFRRGPCGARARISAEFRKLFFNSHVHAFDRARCAPAVASNFTGPCAGGTYRGGQPRATSRALGSNLNLTL
jgi:hypothetical protein